MMSTGFATIAAFPGAQELHNIAKQLKRKADAASLKMDNEAKKFKIEEPVQAAPIMEPQFGAPVAQLEVEMKRWIENLATTDCPSNAILELLGLHAPYELYKKYNVQELILEYLDFDEQLGFDVHELWSYIESLKPKKKCCRNLKKEWEKEMLQKYSHLDKPFFM